MPKIYKRTHKSDGTPVVFATVDQSQVSNTGGFFSLITQLLARVRGHSNDNIRGGGS
jgi:hypothetical protein